MFTALCHEVALRQRLLTLRKTAVYEKFSYEIFVYYNIFTFTKILHYKNFPLNPVWHKTILNKLFPAM